jgi:hypothetical protein
MRTQHRSRRNSLARNRIAHSINGNGKGKHMFDSKLSRRGLVTVATGVAAVGALGATVGTANAYQGNMERALSSLYSALADLKESTPNKGGHRERAMDLVGQAIAQTQAGIEFANEHGGGGN